MFSFRRLLLAPAITLGAFSVASAQIIPVGARVRLPTGIDPQHREIGSVVAARPDSTLVELTRDQAFGAPRAVERRMVSTSSLEVSIGRVRHTGDGVAIGLVGGVVIGGIAGYLGGDDCGPETFICFDRNSTAALGAAVFGGLGTIVGAVAGANHLTDVWAPTSGSHALLIAPNAAGGMNVGFGVRF